MSESLVMRRPRRTRTTFTSSQIAELEQHFLQGRYLTAPRLADLSAKLALGTAQVKIWFKNRRRRHKIQSDQHKDSSYEGMPLSPSMHNGSLKGSDADPPSLQALSLGGSGAAANALTPSPTPSTPTAHLAEQYSESFNTYYNYNNHHTQGSVQQRHLHSQYTSTTPSNATSQFFQQQQQLGGQHEQQQLHQQQQQLHHQHVMAQQQQQQQQYHNFGNGSGCRLPLLKSDNESEYSFNGSYYMRTTALPLAGVAGSMQTVEAVASALSPGSEVYEPLTPKNDESPSLCGGGNGTVTGAGGASSTGGVGVGVAGSLAANAVDDADVTDDMDDGSNKTTTKLQVSER